MRLREAQWLEEESQWQTKGLVHGQGGGGNAVLLFLMPDQDGQGGGGAVYSGGGRDGDKKESWRKY